MYGYIYIYVYTKNYHQFSSLYTGSFMGFPIMDDNSQYMKVVQPLCKSLLQYDRYQGGQVAIGRLYLRHPSCKPLKILKSMSRHV